MEMSSDIVEGLETVVYCNELDKLKYGFQTEATNKNISVISNDHSINTFITSVILALVLNRKKACAVLYGLTLGSIKPFVHYKHHEKHLKVKRPFSCCHVIGQICANTEMPRKYAKLNPTFFHARSSIS